MERDVFVSYSSQDKEVAHRICSWIEQHGITCWIAPRDILPSRTWGESIINAIKGAKLMLVIFSSNANHSPQIKREVERAVHFGVAVLPMRIENVSPTGDLDYFLAMPQWFNAFADPIESHLEALVDVIRKVVTTHANGLTRTAALPLPAATAPSVSPPRPVEPARSVPAPNWSPELLQQVEKHLALTVGPIAKILVKNAAKKSADWPAFTKALADQLDTPQAKAELQEFCHRIEP